jgi:glyoxylase-like metal-dependent hydrolase (beta-lactamase superfamily II)
LTGDYTTLSNGGIIAGRAGVVIVEGTASPEGARWMAERAVALTGRAPTHVVVTHYHGDHARGVDGFGVEDPPAIHATPATAGLVTSGFDAASEPERARPWADVVLIDPGAPTGIDLGDRTVAVVPYEGHTASDVVIDLPDDDVVWCGDLVWNEMFPNYLDAVPSVLSASVRSIVDSGRGTFVPGHGPLADAAAMSTYVSILDDIEGAARSALADGRTAEVAGEAYRLPDGVSEWTLFNPEYFSRAIDAWMRELGSRD